MNAQPRKDAGLAYLAGVQFLFLATWVVYVIYLPDLLAKSGLPKGFLPTLLLIDQLLFACADMLLGFQADRAMHLYRALAPLLMTLNLIACLAFIGLPHIATAVPPSVFIGVTILWVLTASVLRAPLYGLIARRSLAPGQATAASLLGMGLASALAPYLAVALKNLDPVLPFMLSGISLALATLGFSAWEAKQRAVDCAPNSEPKPAFTGIGRLLLAMLLLGGGFQVHFFVNAASLYKSVADASLLPWLMPLFWIGFSLSVYPGARLLERADARSILAQAAMLGAIASLFCLASLPLPGLMVAQFVAGIAWGGVFLAGLDLAGGSGRHGREGLFVGMLFAMLALAAAARIGMTLAGFGQHALPELAFMLWALGAAVCLPWLRPAQSRATPA